MRRRKTDKQIVDTFFSASGNLNVEKTAELCGAAPSSVRKIVGEFHGEGALQEAQLFRDIADHCSSPLEQIVVQELMKIGCSNIKNVIRPEVGTDVNIEHIASLPRNVAASISEVEIDPTLGTVRLKFHSKNQALAQLSKIANEWRKGDLYRAKGAQKLTDLTQMKVIGDVEADG